MRADAVASRFRLIAGGIAPMELVTPLEPSPVRGKQAPRERAMTTRQAVRLTRWVRLDLAAASARGRRREVNEDAHSALNGSAPLFVVADGVGGGAMAARASSELVHRLHGALDNHRIDAGKIRDAVLRADREVGRSIARHTEGAGAATVALCAGSGMLLSRWLIAWVGDCRVYRVRASGEEPAELLTVDDTYGHLSEEPPPGGSRDDPARMVGNGAVSSPNVDQVALHGGEMLVLCSDGIHKHVEPRELSRVLRENAPLARRCGRLLALARARGSRDDATVLVVRREPRHARLALFAAAGALVAALATTLVVTTTERASRVAPHVTTSAPAVDAARTGASTAGPSDPQRSQEAREP
jgi:serine/threonine protein phosphatase PrpC